MEKILWPKWNKSPWFKAPMEKAWFYERLFFEMVIAWLKKILFSITAAQTLLSFSEQYGYNGITLRNLNGVILRLFL